LLPAQTSTGKQKYLLLMLEFWNNIDSAGKEIGFIVIKYVKIWICDHDHRKKYRVVVL
jgi:hypothetical protein